MRVQTISPQYSANKIAPRMGSALCPRAARCLVVSSLSMQSVTLFPPFGPCKSSRLHALGGNGEGGPPAGSSAAGPQQPLGENYPGAPQQPAAVSVPAVQLNRSQPLPPQPQPQYQPQPQPQYQSQYYQRQPQQFYQYSTQTSAGSYQVAQQPYAGGSAAYSTAAEGANAKEPARVNPKQATINSVTLLGTVANPEAQGLSARATINVPYATKSGSQSFFLEAWDAEAAQLMKLQGVKVVVDGFLGVDTGGVKVVAYRLRVVDENLPSAIIRTAASSSSSKSSSSSGKEATAREVLNPEKIWKMHYETQTQTLKDLAAHWGCAVSTVTMHLLNHAFKTSSPLRWRVLAQEAGLGVEDDSDAITLMDFIGLVTAYREQFKEAPGAQQGATPPTPPVSKDGTLLVRPIRDWALGRGTGDHYHYVVEQFQAKYGDSKMYDALRLAVVAEATQGAWDPSVEFKPLA